MVKKLVLDICNTDETVNDINIDNLLEMNKALHDTIIKYKNKITSYYNNKSWDKFKKISNEYELIFTTPNTSANISTYSPVSRSFFKMWEILHDFKIELGLSDQGIKVCMLCEGPGGFA